ncbi:MAG TPA: hypothetical protein VGF59_00880 [Bryobacteraceae bacterium]|jgi:hypothetical protein
MTPLAPQAAAGSGPTIEQRLAALESVFKIEPGGSVTIHCRDLKIITDGSFGVQSSSGLNLKAGMSIRIDASMDLRLRASNAANLEAAATLTLRGSQINEN